MSVKPVAWTPGPWTIGQHASWDKEIPIIGDTAKYKQVQFVVVDNDDACHGDEAEANAALICAAPELAEALQRLLILMHSIQPGAKEKLQAAETSALELLARITPK